AVMYHGFTIETPYFPGYRDVWDNPAMGRCAGQTWGGQRFLSFMLMGGMLDRYPRLRVGTLECGHGWLPHWLLRLTRQIAYVRGGDTEAHVGERRALLPADVDPMGLSGDGGSSGGEIVREILVGSDAAARQAQPERLAGEHLELSAIALEPVRMEVVAHHGGR